MAEQYEYKVVEQRVSGLSKRRTIKDHEEALAGSAAEGWELVSVTSLDAVITYSSLFYLRRPLSPGSPPRS